MIKANHKISINSVNRDPDGRFLILDVAIDGFHVILVNLYGPNNDEPEFYFDVFSKLDNFDSSRMLIAGDLNVALGPLDYRGSCSEHRNINSRKALVSLMDEFKGTSHDSIFQFSLFPYLLIFLQFRDPSYVLSLSTKAVLQK